MRKLFVATIFLVCAINTHLQISNNWKGTIDVKGMILSLVFHLQKELDVYKSQLALLISKWNLLPH